MPATRETKPAYGMLSFSRVTGGDPNLFGSSIEHHEKLRLVLKEGSVQRDLNHDWYLGGNILFEAEMSYTQFAELISAMNCNDGIPVTIRYIQGKGHIDPIQIINRRTQFTEEFAERGKEASQQAKSLIEKAQTILKERKSFTKADKEELLSTLTKLYYEVDSNQSFAIKSFNEAAEGIVAEAKGEIEAFVDSRMHQLALAALHANPDLLTPHQSVVISLPEADTTDTINTTQNNEAPPDDRQ